jgi:hypothetical protein
MWVLQYQLLESLVVSALVLALQEAQAGLVVVLVVQALLEVAQVALALQEVRVLQVGQALVGLVSLHCAYMMAMVT